MTCISKIDCRVDSQHTARYTLRLSHRQPCMDKQFNDGPMILPTWQLTVLHQTCNPLPVISKLWCRRSPYWNLWPSPTLLRKKLGVRLLPCLTFPIIGIYILHNILHLMTWAQKQRRSTTKVTKHFVQCLHLARRFIVSPPWQFLAPPDLPLQQGSDQLNCNSKHLLMLYEYVIKLYCAYINEQGESIFWCNLRFDRSRCDPICDAVLSRGPPPVIR